MGIKTRLERQTTTSSHVRARHPWETCMLFHLVQRISLHFKSPDLYLFCTTKVFLKFLLPVQSQASFQSEEFGSYDYAPQSLSLVACSLSSQRSHILVQKRLLLIPSSSNILQYKNRVFLTGNQRFVYKSKMATKRRVWVANLKFDLQSESSDRSILAIMHFCDAFYLKIKIIQVSFVPLNWAIQPP